MRPELIYLTGAEANFPTVDIAPVVDMMLSAPQVTPQILYIKPYPSNPRP
jgi:hypothetical protein